MDRFETFVGLISQIHKNIQKIKSVEMTEQGLRANHTMCLYHLQRNPSGLTSAQLAAACEEDKAAISRTLTELVGRGYVFCQASGSGKRYRAKLFLTEKGIETARFIRERADGIVERGGEGITPEQRQCLYDALERICENLQRLQNE